MANQALECGLCLEKNFAFLCTFDKSCNCAMIICDACLPQAMKLGKCLWCKEVLKNGHVDKHLTISELDKTNPYYCKFCPDKPLITRAKLFDHNLKNHQPKPIPNNPSEGHSPKELKEVKPPVFAPQFEWDPIPADNLTMDDIYRIIGDRQKKRHLRNHPYDMSYLENHPYDIAHPENRRPNILALVGPSDWLPRTGLGDTLKQIWRDIKKAF